MSTSKLISKKYRAGEYEIAFNGRVFEVSQMCAISEEDIHSNDTTWQLCEIVNNRPEYWNHFATKRDAVNAILEA